MMMMTGSFLPLACLFLSQNVVVMGWTTSRTSTLATVTTRTSRSITSSVSTTTAKGRGSLDWKSRQSPSSSSSRVWSKSPDDKEEEAVEEDDDDTTMVVHEPTVLVNGEDLLNNNDNNSSSGDEKKRLKNQEIMGATAAMAIKTETPMEDTLQHVTNALFPLELVSPTTTTASSDVPSYTPLSIEEIATMVQGKRVALYFAAGWCPMCREFEFMVPQYMKALEESAQPIEFIYVSSDMNLEFQFDRMKKLNIPLGVLPSQAKLLKAKFGIWSGRESNQFLQPSTSTTQLSKEDITTTTTSTTTAAIPAQRKRRSGVPALIVLDTTGEELTFLNVESETIAAMADWPLDDPKGIF